MPHAILKDLKSNLAAFAAQKLGELQAFVVNKVQETILEILEKLKKECPPKEELDKLSAKINTVKSTITSINQKVQPIAALPPKLDPVIIGMKILIEILSHLPVPSTIGTPPGPAGGVVYSVPQGVTQANGAKLRWAQKAVETIEDDQNSIKDLLGSFSGFLDPIQAQLDAIQALIDACYVNQAMTDEERKELFSKLNNQTKDEDLFGVDYTSRGGYTYKIKIQTDPTSPEIAPRRQAIVQDFRGITVLTGPASFASSTDVLIKEIKFRIDNQLP